MDPASAGLPDFEKKVMADDYHTISPNFDQFPDLVNGYEFNMPSPNLHFLESSWLSPDLGHADFTPPTAVAPGAEPYAPFAGDSLSPSPEGTTTPAPSSSDDSEFSETVLKYIGEILMEENVEEESSMFYDPLGLRVTEKSLYDALGQKYPASPKPYLEEPPYVSHSSGSSDDVFFESSGGNYSLSCISSSSNSTDLQRVLNVGEYKASFSQAAVPCANNFQSKSGAKIVDDKEVLAQNIFTDNESVLLFRRGLEEASKFLPRDDQLVIDSRTSMLSAGWNGKEDDGRRVGFKGKKGVKANSTEGQRGRKNHDREDVEVAEGRNSKQSAVYVEESESSEMFDKVLLSTEALSLADNNNNEPLQNEASSGSQPNGRKQGSNVGKNRSKKQGKNKERVDLNNLLIFCAQAVSTGDYRTANDLLKQIRQHSSPHGDGSQRLAHYFADGLEARMVGTGTRSTSSFSFLISNRISAFQALKAYQVNLSVCPFKRISLFFAQGMICKVAKNATSLHIVDFGIGYGFHWPILIKKLSKRAGGPPKLRITAIDFPQPGFRPTERIEKSCRQLAEYCERFNVPFEYHALASQNWETIQIEDLKINRNETLVVNCMNRFHNLSDELVKETSPRDACLKLIRRINPVIFIQSIYNGSYDVPFFVTRFREALFYFSACFDIYDATVPRENLGRLMFERFYGSSVLNVVACEGLERIERPETYKQWHVRTMRAGFRPLPLDREMLTMFRSKLKEWYHKDFELEEDNHWMLHGWKGRILNACSSWAPS